MIYRVYTMTEYTRDEEYKIVDTLIEKYKCRVIKSEERPYTLYCASDIGKIINISNMRNSLLFYPENMIKMRKMNTIGGEQDCKFLTLIGLRSFLTRTRKSKANSLAQDIGIEIEKRKFVSTETDCIDCIKKAFKGEEMIEQYPVGIFKVDLFFPKYDLIIECDENNHKYNIEADTEREKYIRYLFNNDCEFIRFQPDIKDFDMFKVINDIYSFIKNYNDSYIELEECRLRSKYEIHKQYCKN